MSDKEYTVIEIEDVLRRRASGDRISAKVRATGTNRKSIWRQLATWHVRMVETEPGEVAEGRFRQAWISF